MTSNDNLYNNTPYTNTGTYHIRTLLTLTQTQSNQNTGNRFVASEVTSIRGDRDLTQNETLISILSKYRRGRYRAV